MEEAEGENSGCPYGLRWESIREVGVRHGLPFQPMLGEAGYFVRAELGAAKGKSLAAASPSRCATLGRSFLLQQTLCFLSAAKNQKIPCKKPAEMNKKEQMKYLKRPTALGKRLDYWLKYRGLTQKELFDKSCVDLTTIERILNGDTKDPHPNTLKNIAKALDIEVKDLIAGEPWKNVSPGKSNHSIEIVGEREDMIAAISGLPRSRYKVLIERVKASFFFVWYLLKKDKFLSPSSIIIVRIVCIAAILAVSVLIYFRYLGVLMPPKRIGVEPPKIVSDQNILADKSTLPSKSKQAAETEKLAKATQQTIPGMEFLSSFPFHSIPQNTAIENIIEWYRPKHQEETRACPEFLAVYEYRDLYTDENGKNRIRFIASSEPNVELISSVFGPEHNLTREGVLFFSKREKDDIEDSSLGYYCSQSGCGFSFDLGQLMVKPLPGGFLGFIIPPDPDCTEAGIVGAPEAIGSPNRKSCSSSKWTSKQYHEGMYPLQWASGSNEKLTPIDRLILETENSLPRRLVVQGYPRRMFTGFAWPPDCNMARQR